jgi:hypothetical protein
VPKAGKKKRKMRASADRIVAEGEFLSNQLASVEGTEGRGPLFRPLLAGLALGCVVSHFLRSRTG